MSIAPNTPAGLNTAATLDWHSPEITALLERALAEDIGAGDLTTDGVLPERVEAQRVRGRIIGVVRRHSVDTGVPDESAAGREPAE